MTTWADDHSSTDPAPPDPYRRLGVAPTASDRELRRAYHRLAQLHHPDHNGGSPLASRRFAEIQDAYSTIVRQRRRGGQDAAPSILPSSPAATDRHGSGPDESPPPSPRQSWAEPWLDHRISAIERDHESRHEPPPAPGPGSARAHARRSDPNGFRQRLTELFGNA